MKVLVVANEGEDYLADMVLYGLRQRYGAACVDIPRKDVMYKSCSKPKLYGRGFTMWKLLDEVDTRRDGDLVERVAAKEFDVVVFSSILRQSDVFSRLAAAGLHERIEMRFLDGEDDDSQSMHRAALQTRHPYFKREKTVPDDRVLPVSFAVPGEKILPRAAPKVRQFATHVQAQAAYQLPWIRQNCRPDYCFEREADYRADMATSKFAVTMKKGGWDCMRHYEQAANLAVPCFLNLGDKPRDCAPHGLVDGINCVAWSSPEELRRKTDSANYERLLAGATAWIAERTCERLADYVMDPSASAGRAFKP